MSPSVKLKTPRSGSVKSHWGWSVGCWCGSFDARTGPHLLAVGGRGLAELVVVGEDGIVLRVGCLPTLTLSLSRGVSCRSKVVETGLLSPSIELGRGGGERSCQQGQCRERGAHVYGL